MLRVAWLRAAALSLLMSCPGLLPHAAAQVTPTPGVAGPGAPVAASPTPSERAVFVLGPGDEVSMRVFGQPDMNGVSSVSDDGTLRVPLAGSVHVAGLSPSQAARRIEAALRKGQYLVDPHVTLTIVKSLSQRVSVLGDVRSPGIYTIQANTTVLDLLAQAGGITPDGADTIFILRPGADGTVQRLEVSLRGLAQPDMKAGTAEITLRGGDQLYIPRAPVFYISGEVHAPAEYRLRHGLTVLEAISRAGGITPMGSARRVTIRRTKPDGSYQIISARMTDKVEPNDVITVKERIF